MRSSPDWGGARELTVDAERNSVSYWHLTSLVQVNAGKDIVSVDTLAVTDITALGHSLADETVE